MLRWILTALAIALVLGTSIIFRAHIVVVAELAMLILASKFADLVVLLRVLELFERKFTVLAAVLEPCL